jgi:hypothetical protein
VSFNSGRQHAPRPADRGTADVSCPMMSGLVILLLFVLVMAFALSQIGLFR